MCDCMKLVLAIVNDEDSIKVLTALNEKGFQATKLATTGGFLRSGNVTFLIGTDDEKVDEVIEVIRSKSAKRKQISASPVSLGSAGGYFSYPIEVDVGGATIFVLDIDRFEKV